MSFRNTAEDIVASASKRMEELRLSLPDTTRGMFEFCIMLRLMEKGLPGMVTLARSEAFMEHFATWISMGCPDFTPDAATEFEQFKKGPWVN